MKYLHTGDIRILQGGILMFAPFCYKDTVKGIKYHPIGSFMYLHCCVSLWRKKADLESLQCSTLSSSLTMFVSAGLRAETWTAPTPATSSPAGREPRTDRWSTTAETPGLISSQPQWPLVWLVGGWCLTSSPVTFTGARWRSMLTWAGAQSSSGDRRQSSSTGFTTGDRSLFLSNKGIFWGLF